MADTSRGQGKSRGRVAARKSEPPAPANHGGTAAIERIELKVVLDQFRLARLSHAVAEFQTHLGTQFYISSEGRVELEAHLKSLPHRAATTRGAAASGEPEDILLGAGEGGLGADDGSFARRMAFWLLASSHARCPGKNHGGCDGSLFLQQEPATPPYDTKGVPMIDLLAFCDGKTRHDWRNGPIPDPFPPDRTAS